MSLSDVHKIILGVSYCYNSLLSESDGYKGAVMCMVIAKQKHRALVC